MINVTTIEDLLECSANLRKAPPIKLDVSDMTIMHSIARQVFKGTALTDRQLALMQEKLTHYKDQFINLEIDFDFAIDQLRQPLRHIDRSKYIKIVEDWIVVRFPFRKTEIVLVQEAATRAGDGYHHQKGSHKHSFEFTECNVINLLDRFTNKEFVIDEELLEVYKDIKNIQLSPQDHVPGIFDESATNINVSNKLKTIIDEEINNDPIKLIDRKFRYGLTDFVKRDANSLTQDIAYRKDIYVHCRPADVRLNELLTSLFDLDRFPMLVILDKEQAEDQLHSMITYYRDIIDPQEQSVLFRLEDKNAGFNQLVKDRKLNNWVDKSTKIVYISKDKLPKLLVSGEWKPQTAFAFSSSLHRIINTYIGFNCDLVVWREDSISPFREYSRLYG